MIDRDKVMKGIECLADDDGCCHSDCPYFNDRETTSCFQRMAQDVLELLNEQEPVKPIRLENWWKCPACEQNIVANMKYCPGCGKKVKWE